MSSKPTTQHKPIAAISQGKWLDRDVIQNDNFITSHKPDDIPEFKQTLLAVLTKAA